MATSTVLWILIAISYCFQVTLQAGIGEACKEDEECVVPFVNSQRTIWCHNKICSCRDGFGAVGGRCEVGGDCTDDSNCTLIANSYCNTLQRSKTYCACKRGYYKGNNNTECIPGVGTPCKFPQDCRNSNTQDLVCRNKFCTCSDNTVAVEDYRQCIPKVPHNGECSEGIQCNYSIKATCISARCQCITGYEYNGQVCTGKLNLGEECEHDSECVVENDITQRTVLCYNKRCSCRSGFASQSNKCVIGGDCEEDSHCRALENSYCDVLKRDRHSCACIESFVPAGNNTKCLRTIYELGQGCDETEQCTAKLGKAHCHQNQCQCLPGVQLSKDKTTCGGASASAISFACLAVLALLKFT